MIPQFVAQIDANRYGSGRIVDFCDFGLGLFGFGRFEQNSLVIERN
jgi:hypothetical protein